MSLVTNVILTTAIDDKGIIELNNMFFQDLPFVSCGDDTLRSGWYAGSKSLECEIYPGAFNHLNIDDLVSAIQKTKWENPESVQLFILEENEERFKEVDLGYLGPASY